MATQKPNQELVAASQTPTAPQLDMDRLWLVSPWCEQETAATGTGEQQPPTRPKWHSTNSASADSAFDSPPPPIPLPLHAHLPTPPHSRGGIIIKSTSSTSNAAPLERFLTKLRQCLEHMSTLVNSEAFFNTLSSSRHQHHHRDQQEQYQHKLLLEVFIKKKIKQKSMTSYRPSSTVFPTTMFLLPRLPPLPTVTSNTNASSSTSTDSSTMNTSKTTNMEVMNKAQRKVTMTSVVTWDTVYQQVQQMTMMKKLVRKLLRSVDT